MRALRGRALRGPSLRCVAGRREGEDLLAECFSVGICLHLSVILWRMRGRRGLCLQICCVDMMGLSL